MKIHRYYFILFVCVCTAVGAGSLLAFRGRPTLPPPQQAAAAGCCGQQMPDPETATVPDAGPVEATIVRDSRTGAGP